MSKYRREDRDVLVKHRHCTICSTPVAFEKMFCSPRCEGEHARMMRKRKYSMLVTTLVFPLVFVIFMLIAAYRGAG